MLNQCGGVNVEIHCPSQGRCLYPQATATSHFIQTHCVNKASTVLEGHSFISFTNSVDMNLSKLQETVKDRGAWRAAVHGVTKSQAQWSI